MKGVGNELENNGGFCDFNLTEFCIYFFYFFCTREKDELGIFFLFFFAQSGEHSLPKLIKTFRILFLSKLRTGRKIIKCARAKKRENFQFFKFENILEVFK